MALELEESMGERGPGWLPGHLVWISILYSHSGFQLVCHVLLSKVSGGPLTLPPPGRSPGFRLLKGTRELGRKSTS